MTNLPRNRFAVKGRRNTLNPSAVPMDGAICQSPLTTRLLTTAAVTGLRGTARFRAAAVRTCTPIVRAPPIAASSNRRDNPGLLRAPDWPPCLYYSLLKSRRRGYPVRPAVAALCLDSQFSRSHAEHRHSPPRVIQQIASRPALTAFPAYSYHAAKGPRYGSRFVSSVCTFRHSRRRAFGRCFRGR